MPGRILVVDDVATNRIVMKVRLASAFYEVLQAGSGAEALKMAREGRPDLILLDLMMTDMDGVEVCRRLKADPETALIPVLLITAARRPDEKLRALEAGAEGFLSKPLDEVTLLARVRSLMRAFDAEKDLVQKVGAQAALLAGAEGSPGNGRIALIAPDPAVGVIWQKRLAPLLEDTLVVSVRAEVLAQTDTAAEADLYVISADLEGRGDGLRLIADLRARAASRHAGIIVLAAPEDQETAAMALDLGASDLVTTPFEPQEMALRLKNRMRRKKLADRMRAYRDDSVQLALTDALTGLNNRRYAMPHLQALARRAGEEGLSFSILSLDLDLFKSVNDRYGHAAGDAVLVALARVLRGSFRAVDMVARIGGEEFLVALPGTNTVTATAIAERLRKVIGKTPVMIPGQSAALHVSASIGVASWDGAEDTVEALLSRADAALYAAKSAGRNQVTVSGNAA